MSEDGYGITRQAEARGQVAPIGERVIRALGRFACWMDWHKPGPDVTYPTWYGTGRQMTCARCSVTVDIDSQGNCYSTSPLPEPPK